MEAHLRGSAFSNCNCGRKLMAFMQDVRYGLRILVKNPGVAIVIVMTLALGIGASSAIFSVVNAVLLRPLNYPDPGRIVALQSFTHRNVRHASPAHFRHSPGYTP